MADLPLDILVRAKGAAQAAAAITGVDKSMKGIAKTAKQGVGTAIGNIERLGFVAGAAAGGGLLASVKWASDFQAQLNTINTIAQVTPEQLDRIGNGIRTLSVRTGADLSDLTQGYYDLLSAGIKVSDAQVVLNQAYSLGRGALGSTSEAVDVLTTAINAYNLKGSDATRISDELAKAVADGKVTLSDIAASYANVAAVAAQAGIGTNEVAAAYGFLTAKGVPAAEVTTQMSRAIVELQKPTSTLAGLQKKLGKSYADIAKQKGLNVALQQLRTDAKAAGIPFIELFGRIEAYKFALQTTGSNAKAFNAELASIGDSAGTLNKQVGARNQGLAYQLDVLKASLKSAGITIGTALLPKLTPLIQRLNEFLTSHQADISRFADDLANGLGKFFDELTPDRLNSLSRTFGDLVGYAKGLIGAFLSAPSWVQEFLIGGFAANKFTGGAIGSIIGQLGSGLVKGVLGMNAGVVNIKAGVVSGGGAGAITKAGGAVPSGGKGSMAVTGLRVLGTLAVAGPIIAELLDIKNQQTEANHQAEADLSKQTTSFIRGTDDTATIKHALDGINQQIYDLEHTSNADSIAFMLNIDGVRDSVLAQKRSLEAKLDVLTSQSRADNERTFPTQLAMKNAMLGAGANIARFLGRQDIANSLLAQAKNNIGNQSFALARTADGVWATRSAVASQKFVANVPLTVINNISGRSVKASSTRVRITGGKYLV